jgi:hypothetical protein
MVRRARNESRNELEEREPDDPVGEDGLLLRRGEPSWLDIWERAPATKLSRPRCPFCLLCWGRMSELAGHGARASTILGDHIEEISIRVRHPLANWQGCTNA